MNNLFAAIELGKNSILAQQSVFSVIGHNIANVNTPGYSRQVVDMESVRPSVIGLKDSGRGVDVSAIRSIRDQFIDNQITERRKYEGKWDTMSSIMATVESLFDEASGLGLSDSLSSFFNAWSDISNNPTDIPTRNALVSKTQSFTMAMNNSYQRLTDQQEVIDQNIGVLVDEVNSILAEIAELNEEIAYANGTGNQASDLLDQRERSIRDLSEKIPITHYYDSSNNSVTIDMAGRPLVSFTNYNELSAQRNPYNSNYYDVYVDQYGEPAINVTTEIDNGKLGGLLLARDGNVVDGAGTVQDGGAAGVGLTYLNFSQPHGLSVGDLITVNNETRSVVSIAANNQVVVADFDNPLVGGTNYAWQERDGYIPEYKKDLNKLANSLIQQVNDLHQQGYGLGDATAPQRTFFDMTAGTAGISASVDIGGLSVTFNGDVTDTINVGDVISMQGEARLVTGVSAGVGNTTVSVSQPFTTIGPAPSWEYSNLQGGASSIQVNSAIVSDSSLIAASSQQTWDAGNNAPLAVGNNDQAVAIAGLMDGNNTVDTNNDGRLDYGTFHEYLHSTYSEIGNAGSTSSYELAANTSMVNYLENKRDSISGVSLDEEAANLMQYEKSFQALAQFMGTVSQLTDVLIQIV